MYLMDTQSQRYNPTGSSMLGDGRLSKSDPHEMYHNQFRPTFLKLLTQSCVPKPEWQHLFFSVHQYIMWADPKDDVALTLYKILREDTKQAVAVARDFIGAEHDDMSFLQKYVHHWTEYLVLSLYAHLPFQSIDQALLEGPDAASFKSGVKNDDLGPIRRMFMEVWNETVLSTFTTRLLQIVSSMMVTEREEGLIYASLITGVRDSFFLVSPLRSFFEDTYEQMYLSTLETYYNRVADERFNSGSVVDYARWAEQTFHDEHSRARKYLVPSKTYNEPVNRMNEKLVNILIKNSRVFDSAIAESRRMVEEHRNEALSILFKLLDRVEDGPKSLINCVQEYIVRKGKDDMMESASIVANDAEKYVEKLLTLYQTFSTLVHEAFNDDHRFTSARDRGFQEVVNDSSVFAVQFKGRSGNIESRCPEMLANFCDSLLRKTTLSRRLGSDEVSQRLKSTLQVLKYITSKDIFMQIYQTTLARRLILGLSVDSELEEEMTRWLANVGMPAEVINRINRMFGDVRVSEDLSKLWTEHAKESLPPSRIGEVDPKVLNGHSWTRLGSERTVCHIPAETEEFLTEFEKWYCGRFQGRKLALTCSSSTVVAQFTSNAGQYELELTMFQMTVLKAFIDCQKAKLSLEALQVATDLPQNELRRTLWTLCTLAKCGNVVMCYSPKVQSAKDLETSTHFWINMNFAPLRAGRPQKRGRINLIGKLQIGGERHVEEDQENITALRELRVQEAVTKVMKTRKTATMTEIHTEAIELLKNMFAPNRKILKEQVEFLIEKGYLARDERDLNVFHYVA